MARAIDIAQVTYEAPDLALMERFMTDFGLHRVPSADGSLYMRGSGRQHHLHVARHSARQRFVGATLEVASKADLEELAVLPGSSPIEWSTEPGGGWQVVMHTPDGIEIRAVWGREHAAPLSFRSRHILNASKAKPRVGSPIRDKCEPSEAIRRCHFVLHVRNHNETVKWFRNRFGMLPSDIFLLPGTDGPPYGTFLRFDRGVELVDRHSLLIMQSDGVRGRHRSPKIQDIYTIMSERDYLVQHGWQLDHFQASPETCAAYDQRVATGRPAFSPPQESTP